MFIHLEKNVSVYICFKKLLSIKKIKLHLKHLSFTKNHDKIN